MCGITGIVAKDSKEYRVQLEGAITSLKHRGPDGNGRYFFANCALGHTRLSIVDLSNGTQPMISSDGNVGVTFNGEIYGYKEIKSELNDYTFKTTSDTEVLITLYQKYGTEMINKLPGMFAFGIWDDNKQRLFCARDRFGEKPFYYAQGKSGEFIFASEIKALLATGLIIPILDNDSLLHFLKHLYIAPNKTIYKNIYSLPPAHTLTFEQGRIEINKYWDLPSTNDKISLHEAKTTFQTLLEKAVAKQLVADVPVGAFLSGGLDSTTIVSVASKLKTDLQSFSFGFGDSINELPYAKMAAKRYNTDHRELHAKDYDLASLLIKMQEIYDEPFADSSNIPTYLISKLAKEHNKVVLTGDGGDELFGGYTSWYKPIYFMLQKQPLKLSAVTKDLVNIFHREARCDLYYRMQGFWNKITGKNPLQAHINKNTYFSDGELEQLFGKDVSITKQKKTSDSLDEIIRFDIENYMPGDILTKIDRASMANGLELRSPFLDVDFATFCISLPSRLKINDKEDKLILREVFSKDWPEEIRKRSKQGFGSPINKWLKLPSFRELKQKYLNDVNSKIYKILDYKQCSKVIKKNNYKTWILLTLAIWLEKHEYQLAEK